MGSGETSPIYRDLMRFKPEELTPNAWAVKAGVSRTVWADMRRHGNPSRRTLERLLAAVGSTVAEFEALRIGGPTPTDTMVAGLAERGSPSWRSPQLPPLPLLATAIAGNWDRGPAGISLIELRTSEIIERIMRPVSLANDSTAYAITIVADSMWPRFRPGRRVAVSPKAPVAIGDDIVVKLKNDAGPAAPAVAVLVGEFVRRTAEGVELRQFNPAATFHVANADFVAIEKVMGELI